MPPRPPQASTVGSKSFDPDKFISQWAPAVAPENNNLQSFISRTFGLPTSDSYVYHAIASVTLAQVQKAINYGGQGGLHAWYRDEEGKEIPPPPASDITAYTAIFSPQASLEAAIRGFKSNAKKGSLRATVASHIESQQSLPKTPLRLPPKQKNPTPNPYLDLWAWSCHCLEWCGPTSETKNTHFSHHILPIFYHHFGCVCPSYAALSIISQLAGSAMGSNGGSGAKQPGSKSIIEIGSGNGYWAFLLRKLGLSVYAVDNAASAWRTTWISDTIISDGIEFLKANNSGRESILLLVYPQVGHDFTGKVLRSYEGDTIVVAGTQNENGFTAFKGETVADWMAREKEGWEKVVQIPLPSFAGKDEALFVFTKRQVIQEQD